VDTAAARSAFAEKPSLVFLALAALISIKCASERSDGSVTGRTRVEDLVDGLDLGRVLIAPLGGPHEVISWAIVNGGRRRADCVVWREVRRADLDVDTDASALLRDSLARVGHPDAVGLLTARDLRRFEEERVERAGVQAWCVATVGLGNALAVGDLPQTGRVGTINLLCQVSLALSEEALIEACAVAAEARTAALLAAGIRSTVSGRPAGGTGTDCIVIAAAVPQDKSEPFAGKYTPCGSAIGAAVYRAVERGTQRWLEDNGMRPRAVSTRIGEAT
jgi:adenosylcobinamide amidohydrolase